MKLNLKRIKDKMRVFIYVLFIVTIISFGIYYFLMLEKESKKYVNKNDSIIKENNDETLLEVKEEMNNEESPVVENISNCGMVDVKGEVLHPGIYSISCEMRINDVIDIAGGVTNNADTSITNLSKKVYDEMVIYIYSKEEVIKLTSVNTSSCSEKEIILNGSCTIEDINDNKLININTAGIEELMKISGIGEVKAKAIIQYRTYVSLFTCIEDILNVEGIGESLFESIKNFITV